MKTSRRTWICLAGVSLCVVIASLIYIGGFSYTMRSPATSKELMADSEIALLHEVIRQYKKTHGENPPLENAKLVRALNIQREPGSFNLNKKQELVDPLGRVLVFKEVNWEITIEAK